LFFNFTLSNIYFWDYAEANSGAARERYLISNSTQDENTVTTGGSGMGLMGGLSPA